MRTIPAPRVLPEAASYWAAADEGRLLLKTCDDCGRPHHYPRDVCPHCLGTSTRWQPAAGTGTVYSYSTMGQGDAVHTIAFVTLDEGVTMLTNLVDCDPRLLAVGQRVKVVFKPSDGGPAVPMFTPA